MATELPIRFLSDGASSSPVLAQWLGKESIILKIVRDSARYHVRTRIVNQHLFILLLWKARHGEGCRIQIICEVEEILETHHSLLAPSGDDLRLLTLAEFTSVTL